MSKRDDFMEHLKRRQEEARERRETRAAPPSKLDVSEMSVEQLEVEEHRLFRERLKAEGELLRATQQKVSEATARSEVRPERSKLTRVLNGRRRPFWR